ncbi:MAG: F0F1 ATP synthase subunit epsilon [Myxococcaceae bacterium]
MAKLNVELVTPEKRILSVQADEVVVPGHPGLFGVRPGHTPVLSIMDDGLLTLKDGGTSQVFHVEGGFVEVGNDRVRVLANAAYPVSAIDLATAQKRLEEAAARLKGLSEADARFEVESAVVRREAARIASATRHY